MGVIYYKNKQYASGGGDSEETLYTAGTGIQISEDKVISTKDIKKNYIDNSNFRINQTGASEYSTPNEYTVDRWYIDGGTLKPVENGVQFINPNTESGSSTLIRLRQNIHYGFSEFTGKTLTLSAKINGKIYSATATIPTEKPTEGTAAQFITAGIADFSINLNYSITADYFVPYIAVAYGRTVLIEWMKLEVNGEFSGYIEPDYMTELIKMNFTTPDKGALDIPTGGESYNDTEIKEDIEEIRNSIPSTVKVKTGDFVTNSNGDIDPVILFNIGNNVTDAIYYDNYLFAVSGEQPILYIVDSSNALMQVQCQGGDNAGFKKVAVCKDVSENYTVFLTSVNNIVFFGSVNMSSNTLFFMGSVNESLIAVQHGKNVLSLNQMGNININNCNGDIINFNQELGVISLETFTSISDVRLFGNTTVAVKGIDSMGVEIYHIYDMSTGERWFFQDVTDENTTFTIDNIIAVILYKDNLIIYSDQGMFYTIPNGSFYNPLAIAEKDEVANIIKVRSYTMLFNPMDFTADYANMDIVGEHLVLMGQTETAIYSPNTAPKTVRFNGICKAFDGGNGIYFITTRECVMAEYETEEVDITEAFMRL